MIKLTIQSVLQTLLWTVVAGIAYPLVMTFALQLCFRDQAEGSLLLKDGQVVGSALIAQQFQGSNYFWPRPSAGSYATTPSGASNLGPTSGALQTNVNNNLAAFRSGNNLSSNTPVPADMVFTSASGLDPHISPDSAQLQVARVAASRNLSAESVNALVQKFVEQPQWGFLGEPRVNVLRLNLALDRLEPGMKKAEAAAPKRGG